MLFSRICGQNDELKDMLNNLDLGKLEEIDRMRQEAGESGAQGMGGAGLSGGGATVVNANIQMGNLHRQYKFTGECE